MASIILPRRRFDQPSNARASDLALANGCGALLLPTDTGWSDSLNMLSVTGSAGSPTTVASASGVARSYSATADFFQDLGLLDPTNGYAWLMHCTLTSSGGSWGGLISRTRDNSTTAGWGWQKDNAGNFRVYHGPSTAYTLVSASVLIDSLPHTLMGLWRADTNTVELWRDGVLLSSGTMTTVPDYTAGQGQIKLFASRDTSTFVGSAALAGLFTGRMDQAAASELTANPWQLFSGKRVLYFDFGGVGGITGTGTLSVSSTTASGSGVISHTGTGYLSNNVVTASGSGVISHTGTGSLTTNVATLSGVGTKIHSGTGSLTTSEAVVDGLGSVSTAGTVTGTGAIAVGAVSASGAGVLSHIGTGALSNNVVTLAGSGVISHTGTGAIAVGNATLSGSGFLGSGITGSGTIIIGNVTVSGTGMRYGWDVVPDSADTWSDVAANSDGWSIVANASGSWTVQ